MRTFISFPISEEAIKELVNIQEELKKYNEKLPVKWSEDLNLHVTVDFLGEIENGQKEEVARILRGVASRQQSFTYWLDELGCFPDAESPRVLMVKLRENRMQSILIHDEIHRELKKIGLKLNGSSWIPHITLGWIKNNNEEPVVMKKIKIKSVSWLVDRMEIFKSNQKPNGKRYELLEELKFSDISESFILAKKFFNKEVDLIIDKPIGTINPKFKFVYESNYGYVPKTMGPDGEELDAYYLGTTEPLLRAKGKCIAIIHRFGDDDDKLVVVPPGLELTDKEIIKATYFQEKWFKNKIFRG